MINKYKYIEDILIKFNMSYFKAAPFPFLSGISLEEGKSTPPMDSTIYRHLIGILLYLKH